MPETFAIVLATAASEAKPPGARRKLRCERKHQAGAEGGERESRIFGGHGAPSSIIIGYAH